MERSFFFFVEKKTIFIPFQPNQLTTPLIWDIHPAFVKLRKIMNKIYAIQPFLIVHNWNQKYNIKIHNETETQTSARAYHGNITPKKFEILALGQQEILPSIFSFLPKTKRVNMHFIAL
ncbi:hypothetical protein ACJX0J_019241, partial [Zea mays]